MILLIILVIIIVTVLIFLWTCVNAKSNTNNITSDEIHTNDQHKKLQNYKLKNSLAELELNGAIVYLGTKHTKEWVRCIELRNGIYIFPPYRSGPIWKKKDTNIQIHLYDDPTITAIIPSSCTRKSYYACWGYDPNSINVESIEFIILLQQIKKSNLPDI